MMQERAGKMCNKEEKDEKKKKKRRERYRDQEIELLFPPCVFLTLSRYSFSLFALSASHVDPPSTCLYLLGCQMLTLCLHVPVLLLSMSRVTKERILRGRGGKIIPKTNERLMDSDPEDDSMLIPCLSTRENGSLIASS